MDCRVKQIVIPISIFKHCIFQKKILYALRLKLNFIAIFFSCVLLTNISYSAEVGQSTGLPIPRFISLKFNETNLRKGPNSKYPIVLIYKVKSYPMEVTAEFENWRRIRDIDGVEGWVHENLISGSRNAIINGSNYLTPESEFTKNTRELFIFRYPDENSYPMARAEIGVIVKLTSCKEQWCKIKVENISGWVRKINLWGVYAEEKFN